MIGKRATGLLILLTFLGTTSSCGSSGGSSELRVKIERTTTSSTTTCGGLAAGSSLHAPRATPTLPPDQVGVVSEDTVSILTPSGDTLRTIPYGWVASEARWSLDGNSVALTKYGGVDIMNVSDGSRSSIEATDVSLAERLDTVAIAPSDTVVAFVRGGTEVVIRDRSDSLAERVFDAEPYVDDLKWNEKSQFLLVDRGDKGLLVLNTQGELVADLSEFASFGSWVDTETLIARRGDEGLFLVDLVHMEATQVAGLVETGAVGNIGVSPDGRFLAAITAAGDDYAIVDNAKLCVFDLRAPDVGTRELATGIAVDFEPKWSSDSAHVMFAVGNPTAGQLQYVGVDGGESHLITDGSRGSQTDAAWIFPESSNASH